MRKNPGAVHALSIPFKMLSYVLSNGQLTAHGRVWGTSGRPPPVRATKWYIKVGNIKLVSFSAVTVQTIHNFELRRFSHIEFILLIQELFLFIRYNNN